MGSACVALQCRNACRLGLVGRAIASQGRGCEKGGRQRACATVCTCVYMCVHVHGQNMWVGQPIFTFTLAAAAVACMVLRV